MIKFSKYLELVMEGGNKAKSDSIPKEYIIPTLKHFSKEIKKVFPEIEFDYSTLGSAGHKPLSGDIDLSLDITEFLDSDYSLLKSSKLNKQEFEQRFLKLKSKAKTSTDEKLKIKAVCQLIFERIDSSKMSEYLVDPSSSKVQNVIFFKYPQINEKGKETDKTVQIDLNIGNKEWLKFAYYSSPNIYSDEFISKYGKIKGLHRTQLLVALFTAVGLVFDHTSGIKNKLTGEIYGKTPKDAVKLLNKEYKGFNLKEEDMDNYESLMSKIRKLSKKDQENIIKEYLTILHSAGYEDIEKPKDLKNEIEKYGFTQKIRKTKV